MLESPSLEVLTRPETPKKLQGHPYGKEAQGSPPLGSPPRRSDRSPRLAPRRAPPRGGPGAGAGAGASRTPPRAAAERRLRCGAGGWLLREPRPCRARWPCWTPQVRRLRDPRGGGRAAREPPGGEKRPRGFRVCEGWRGRSTAQIFFFSS